jgi:uncharacterized protein
MRVDNRGRPERIEYKKRSDVARKNMDTEMSFKNTLEQTNQQEVKNRLDKLMIIIDKQGEKLKKSLDKKDLIEYKKRVRNYLQNIHKEFSGTKQSFAWDGSGNIKTYTIIKNVDKNLELLHNLFLQEQADVLEVVKRLDEIRGLLLDLYI